jgi:4-diphosphocytidyl-2C-methyl-D-erythritol kinase
MSSRDEELDSEEESLRDSSVQEEDDDDEEDDKHKLQSLLNIVGNTKLLYLFIRKHNTSKSWKTKKRISKEKYNLKSKKLSTLKEKMKLCVKVHYIFLLP